MKNYYFLLLFSLFAYSLQGQRVTTVIQNSDVVDALIPLGNGELIGADYNGNSIYKLNIHDGTSQVFATGFQAPNGMAILQDSIVVMADNIGHRLFKIYPDGHFELFVNNYFSPSGLIKTPDSDTLIVTSYTGNKISKITPDGQVIDWVVGGSFNGPVGMCYDDEDNLYVGNFNDRRIFRVDSTGATTPFISIPGNGFLGFIEYAGGFIYGTLFNQHRIYRVDLDGNGSYYLGSTQGNDDGNSTEARFNSPNGIVASATGDTLFVSDLTTGNIRMITELEGLSNTSETPIQSHKVTTLSNPGSILIKAESTKEEDLYITLTDVGTGRGEGQWKAQTNQTLEVTYRNDHRLAPRIGHLAIHNDEGLIYSELIQLY